MAGFGTPGIPSFQYADDPDVISARFSAIERKLAEPPRRPGVGRWVLDEDSNGNPVLINLKTNMQYPVTLGPGTALPSS